MDIFTIDVESFWSQTYSLTKMSPLEYVLGDEFETVSCSIKLNDYPTDVFFGHDNVAKAFKSIAAPLANALLIAHNMSGFDAYVAHYVFGLKPKMWGCTLAMARPLHTKTVGLSLAKLVQHYGLGVKNNAVLMQTRGKHLADFTAAELEDMKTYNRADTDQCYALFKRLRPSISAAEMWQIDALTRMRVEPKFEVDTQMLEVARGMERHQKQTSVLRLAQHLRKSGFASEQIGVTTTVETLEEAVRVELASAPKFAALLESLGVTVPMKPSPTGGGKQIPALAKTDEAFTDLQQHDNPIVAAAARARLAVKSTLLETRIDKFLTAASLTGGLLPVPLRYCGADTTGRDSGEEYNCMTAGHELLTPAGWVDIATWTPDTPIMQWWPDGTLDWCRDPGKVERFEQGPLIEFDAPFVRGRFTTDHRMVHLVKGEARDTTAGAVFDRSGIDGIPAAGMYAGQEPSKLSDAQIRLLVACAADATSTEYHIRWGFRRQRKIDRLKALLAEAGVAYRAYDYRDKPDNHYVITVLKSEAGSWLKKGFDRWVLELTGGQMDVLLDELPKWDGMEHSRTGNTCFFTSKKDQADWVATVAHLRGKPARLGARSLGRFDLYFRSSITTSVSAKQKRKVQAAAAEMVYCPKVGSSYVLIRYNGAIHITGNCQNLPRIGGTPKISDALRNCMKAPKGYRVIVADQSGIELRVNHFLWKVQSSMELYAANPEADLYKAFAAARYKKLPEEVTKPERQLAKLCQLGLGFGAGWKTFLRVAKTMGGLDLTDDESEGITDAWRNQYAEIVRGWKLGQAAMGRVHAGSEVSVDPWGMVTTCAEGLRLPSGRMIRYPDLRQEEGAWPDGRARQEWVYGSGRYKSFMHGGKVVENIVQALARDSIFDCSIDFYKSTRLRPALRVHDELVYVVPESEAVSLLAELQRVMRTPPKWWPELIVHSEGDHANSYGAAK